MNEPKIVEGVGKATIKVRQALKRLVEATQLKPSRPTERVTISIAKVEIVKKDAEGNVIERIVDGDNR